MFVPFHVHCRGRADSGWPPKEIRELEDNRFNIVHHMDTKDGYRIFRWVDNNVVKFVSNVHLGTESIKKECCRPRINELNKVGVRSVWGEDHTKKIRIPGIVDDYNHWMLGVDVADQLFASY